MPPLPRLSLRTTVWPVPDACRWNQFMVFPARTEGSRRKFLCARMRSGAVEDVRGEPPYAIHGACGGVSGGAAAVPCLRRPTRQSARALRFSAGSRCIADLESAVHHKIRLSLKRSGLCPAFLPRRTPSFWNQHVAGVIHNLLIQCVLSLKRSRCFRMTDSKSAMLSAAHSRSGCRAAWRRPSGMGAHSSP